ncbi:hypothetical protein TCAL_07768 [Tigriopus californicus]|uniref:Major facilitator superfamily (MFS) profile domain-containing protein n=1 Tax=Tigriopus californicus TaxID=6832 RepID=A0A553P7X2_TIGCA|nr:organic anion transporter 3-like [Tigriopus californicus]TRY73794.1 hypothetical protein TCAL_07768 [Tigriopus californicus]
MADAPIEKSRDPLKISREEQNQHLEDILELSGGFGRFQVFQLVISLILSILCSCNHLGAIFVSFSPRFRCGNSSPVAPLDQNLTLDETFSSNCSDRCLTHEFDESTMVRTFVTDFDLVCDRLYLLPTLTGVYMAGIVVFNGAGGILSDHFGRRKVILFLGALHILSAFVTILVSSSYVGIMVLRFFVGGSIHASWSAFFVLASELTVERRRGVSGGVLNFGWNLGTIFLATVAFLLRDWHLLQWVFAGMSLVMVSYYFLVLESPRWLLRQGKFIEAENVYFRIAKANGVNDPTVLELMQQKLDMVRTVSESILIEQDQGFLKDGSFRSFLKQAQERIAELLRNQELVKRFALMSIPWFAIGMASYGIHFSAKLVAFDIFSLTIIKEATVIVTIGVLVAFYAEMRRTITLFLLCGLSGGFCIAFLFLDESLSLTRGIWLIVCQALITSNFFLLNTYTAEVFSTDVRNSVFSLIESFGKFGSLLAPFVVDLGGETHRGLPPAVFGMFLVLAAAVFLFMPETKSQPLTQGVEDLKDEKNSIAVLCSSRLRK